MVSGGHAYNYAVTLSENTAPAATEIAANLFLRHVAPILRSSSEDVLLSSVAVLCWTRLQMIITNDPPTSECGCSQSCSKLSSSAYLPAKLSPLCCGLINCSPCETRCERSWS